MNLSTLLLSSLQPQEQEQQVVVEEVEEEAEGPASLQPDEEEVFVALPLRSIHRHYHHPSPLMPTNQSRHLRHQVQTRLHS
jgi:hypothetical protein